MHRMRRSLMREILFWLKRIGQNSMVVMRMAMVMVMSMVWTGLLMEIERILGGVMGRVCGPSSFSKIKQVGMHHPRYNRIRVQTLL